MRKKRGNLHIVDYKTRLVTADIRAQDYIEDKRHWEIKKSVDLLDVKLLESSPYVPLLMQQNLLLKETRPGYMTPYVITEIEKDTDAKTVTVLASGEWTLLDSDGYIPPQKISSWTAKKYLEYSLKGTDWTPGVIEATGERSLTINEFVSPLKLLNMIATLFDNYELQYRVKVQGAAIVKRYVDLVEKRGRYTAKEITIAKDLQGIVRTENSEGVITALVGYVMVQGANGQEEVMTVADVNGGIPYVVDEEAFQRWNINGKHRFGFYTPETDNTNMTPERLMTLTKTALKKRIDTNVTYEVDAVDLSRISNLSHEAINEGDTVLIKDKTLNPPLYLEARAIAADESYKDPRRDKFYFGNYRELGDGGDVLQRAYQRILASLQDKVPAEMFAQLEEKVNSQNDAIVDAGKKADEAHKEAQTAKDLASQVEKNLDNYQTAINESPTPPTENLVSGKTLWLDSSNPDAKALKLWNGTDWEPLGPDTEGITTELTNIKGELGSKISEKQMEDYIGELGSTNILLNTPFEKKTVNDFGDIVTREPSLDRWTLQAVNTDRTVTVDTLRHFNGSNSIVIDSKNTLSNVWCGFFQDAPASKGSGKYLFSAMLYVDDASLLTEGGAFKLQFLNGKTKVGQYVQHEYKDLAVNGKWVRITTEIDTEVHAQGLDFTSVRAEVWVRKQGKVWVSQPQCIQGSKLPTYMPNPRDITNYDEMVRGIADKVTLEAFNTRNSLYDTQFQQTTQSIDLKASKTDVYTKNEGDGRYGEKAMVLRHESSIKVQADEIALRVKNDEVASAINLTPQTVLLQAQKINLDGYVEAKHIRTGSLKGVTIMTEDESSSNNHMRLEKQNLTLFGTGRTRGFLGFVPRTDGSFTEALVLGNNYTGAGGTVNDSLVLAHTTPNATQFTNSVATIGLASGKDAAGNILKSSYIKFDRYLDKMSVYSKGEMSIAGNNNIKISAQGTYLIDMYAGSHIAFRANGGRWDFIREKTLTDDKIAIIDDGTNPHLEIAGKVIRVHRNDKAVYGFYFLDRPAVEDIYSMYADINAKSGWFAGNVTVTNHLKYKTYEQTSTRDIKTAIKDFTGDSVDLIMSMKPRQYIFKTDLETLDAMNEKSRDEGSNRVFTTDDIFQQYGFIVEELNPIFHGINGKSVSPYTISTIHIAATQQIKLKQDNHEAEIISLKEKVSYQETRLNELEALVRQLLAN